MKSLGAKIVSLEQFKKLRPRLKGTIVMTSGGFDPIHPGHISCFQESKKLGDILIVSVNSDWFLATKKGKPFQDLMTRAMIIAGIRGVDYVIPFDGEGDFGQEKILEAVRPHIFTKGGNRSSLAMLPKKEAAVIKQNHIKVTFNVGIDKKWSSSDFLDDWVRFKTGQNDATEAVRTRAFYQKSYSGK